MGKEQDLLDASRSGQLAIVDKILCGRIKKSGPLQLTSLRRLPGPNTSDPQNGFTCLHYASLNGHKEIVRLLLEHGANPNIVDHNGSSPLHLASWTGDYEIVDMLSVNPGQKANINLKNKDNETALHSASQYGHTAVVSLLLTQGADPFIRNVRNESALDLAAQYGRLETIELLLGMRFDLLNEFMLVDRRNVGLLGLSSSLAPHSPLHLASRNGHKSIVKLLLDMGFDVDFLTQNGTALHEAVLCGKVEVVRMLLEAGSDIYLENEKGQKVEELLNGLNTSVAKQTKQLIQEHTQSIVHSNRSHLVSPLSESTTLAASNNSFCDQEDLTLVDSMLNEDIALYNNEFEEMMLDDDGDSNVQCISPPPGYSDLAPEHLQNHLGNESINHLDHHGLDNLEGTVSPSSSLFSASIFSELASIFDEHLTRTSAEDSNEDLAKIIKPSTSFTLSDFNHHRNPQYDSDYHDSTTEKVMHHQSFDAVYLQDNSNLRLMSSSLNSNSRFGENEFGELKPKYPNSATSATSANSNCDMMQLSNYSLSSVASSIPGDPTAAPLRSDVNPNGSGGNLLDQPPAAVSGNKPRPPIKPPRKSIDHSSRKSHHLADHKLSKTRSSIDCIRNADLAKSDFNVSYEIQSSSSSVDVPSTTLQAAESISDLLDSDHSNSQHLSSVISISKLNSNKNRKNKESKQQSKQQQIVNDVDTNRNEDDNTDNRRQSNSPGTVISSSVTLTQSIDDFYMLYDQVAKSSSSSSNVGFNVRRESPNQSHHHHHQQHQNSSQFSSTKHSSLDLLQQPDTDRNNNRDSSHNLNSHSRASNHSTLLSSPSSSVSVSSGATATLITTATVTLTSAIPSTPLMATTSINSQIAPNSFAAAAFDPTPGTAVTELDLKPPPSPSKAENVIFTAIEPLKQEKRRKRKKRISTVTLATGGSEAIKFGVPSGSSTGAANDYYEGNNSHPNHHQHQQQQYSRLNKRDNWTLTDDDDFRLANVVETASNGSIGVTDFRESGVNYDCDYTGRQINHKSVAVSTDELEPVKINDNGRGRSTKLDINNSRRNQQQQPQPNNRRKVARSSNQTENLTNSVKQRDENIDPNNNNNTATEKSDYFSVYCETLKFDRKGEKGNPFAGLCRGGLTPIKTASNNNNNSSGKQLNGISNNKMTSSSSSNNNINNNNNGAGHGRDNHGQTKSKKTVELSETRKSLRRQRSILGGRAESLTKLTSKFSVYCESNNGNNNNNNSFDTKSVDGYGYGYDGCSSPSGATTTTTNNNTVVGHGHNIYATLRKNKKKSKSLNGDSILAIGQSIDQKESNNGSRVNQNTESNQGLLNCVSDLSNRTNPESILKQNIEQLNQWLKQISMQQYLDLLVLNGYDNLQFMDTNVMDDCDLLEIGIINASHRDTILKAMFARTTPSIFKLNKSHLITLTVGDWLALLDLGHYEELFHKNQINELRKVRNIWEVELETMFEMDKIGHRRRIMHSLRDLSRESILIDDDGLSSWLTDTSTGTGNGNEQHYVSSNKSAEQQQQQSTKPVDTESVSGEAIGAWKGWKHARQELVNGSCHYSVCYLGSTLVRELRGIDSTRASIGKMKLIVQDKKTRVPKILLVISCKGVQFKDSISTNLICEHEIRNIHCICQDSEDLNYFAYITKDFESNNHYCHVFMSQQTDLVTEIILTLGQAFEIAYQIVLEQYNIHASNYVAAQQQQLQEQESEQKRQSTGADESVDEHQIVEEQTLSEISSSQIMRPPSLDRQFDNSEATIISSLKADLIELLPSEGPTSGNGSNYSTYVKCTSNERKHYHNVDDGVTNSSQSTNIVGVDKPVKHNSSINIVPKPPIEHEELLSAIANKVAVNGRKIGVTGIAANNQSVQVKVNDKGSVKVINESNQHQNHHIRTKIYANPAIEQIQQSQSQPQVEELYAVVDKSKKANRINQSIKNQSNQEEMVSQEQQQPRPPSQSEIKPRPPRRSSSTTTTPTSTAQRPEIKPKPPIRVTSMQSTSSSSGTMPNNNNSGITIKPEVSPKPKNLLSKSHTTAGHGSSNKPAIPAKPSLGTGSGYSSSNCSSPQPP